MQPVDVLLTVKQVVPNPVGDEQKCEHHVVQTFARSLKHFLKKQNFITVSASL
jgi:hypothetical protein